MYYEVKLPSTEKSFGSKVALLFYRGFYPSQSLASSSRLSATSITSRQSPRIMLFSAISSKRAMVEFQKPFML